MEVDPCIDTVAVRSETFSSKKIACVFSFIDYVHEDVESTKF